MRAKDKLTALKNGSVLITNDQELDEMLMIDDPAVMTIRTLPNPKRCGLLDQYIAWIGEYRDTPPDVTQ